MRWRKRPSESVYDYLKLSGYEPWLDKKKILPGQNWEDEIISALKKTDFVILLLSKTSVEKRGFLQREVKLALKYCEEKLDTDIFIIPCKIDDCVVPEKLEKYQWIKLTNPSSFGQITEALNLQRKTYMKYMNWDEKNRYYFVYQSEKIYCAKSNGMISVFTSLRNAVTDKDYFPLGYRAKYMMPAEMQECCDVKGNTHSVKICSVAVLDREGNILNMEYKIPEDEFWGCSLERAYNNNWVSEEMYKKILGENSNEDEITNLIKKGKAWLDICDYKHAKECFQKVLEINPDAISYSYLGEIYWSQGENNNAINCFQNAIGINPRYAKAHYQVGRLYCLQKDYGTALKHFQKVVEIEPTYDSIYYLIGMCYFRVKDYNNALKNLETADKYAPNDKELLHFLAAVNLQLYNDNSAINYYKRIINIDPNDEIACNTILELKKAARLGDVKSQKLLQSNSITW